MIESRGRRLDPPQVTFSDNLRPGNRDFGMPAEDVGGREPFGDTFLARVDHLIIRSGHCADLG